MNMHVTTVAIVDDDAAIRAALRQMFELERLTSIEFADAESALEQIDSSFAGIVISDLRMPGLDGSGFFDRLFCRDPELPVIMISGHGDIATAVELVRRGAYDFLVKPFEAEKLIASVHRAIEKRALVLENRRLRNQPTVLTRGTILGESPEIDHLRQTLTRLAQADIDVMITGESGVGKSLVASTLHNRSPRSRKSMITVNCDALSGEHSESLLFGHVSGGLQGAQFPRSGQLSLADGGTLVLDHVNGLPQILQARIQHALELRSFMPVGGNQLRTSSFRTISTTAISLDDMVAQGDFDRSLYFRLGGYRLVVPPLRDRRDDAIVLFRAFLADAAAELNREAPALSPAIWRRLQDHHWPGNVRELRSFAANVALGVGDPTVPMPVQTPGAGLKDAITAFEADMIRTILESNCGNIAATMETLQIPRKTLYDKLSRHSIDARDYRASGARRR